MKTIVYRGGLLKFELPEDWVEEYGEEGGGTFYLEEQDSGTLRLNVLGYDCRSPQTQRSALEALNGEDDSADLVIETLPDGRSAMKSYDKLSIEDGDEIKLWFWEIASVAKPQHMRFAIFSYCALASQENTAMVKTDLAMINKSLRQIEFAEEFGE